MRVVRTILVAIAAALAAYPGAAFPVSAVERALAFAACAGRYSAELEHAWLLRPGDSDDPAIRRDAFVTLLDAVTADALADGLPEHLLMATRIEEKAAQAMLLSRATFHLDPLASTAAAEAAARRLAPCGDWLLGA
jgi:hypothetical protein